VRDVNGDRFSINLGSVSSHRRVVWGRRYYIVVICCCRARDRSSAEINGRCTCSGVAGPDRTVGQRSGTGRASRRRPPRPLRFHRRQPKRPRSRRWVHADDWRRCARVAVAGRAGRRQHRFGCVRPSWCRRQFPPIVGPPSRPARGARCRFGPAAHAVSSPHDIVSL